MSKLVLRPPDHFYSFTLQGGCGKPHEYDGSTPIDCEKCVAHVAQLSPEERCQDMTLRAPGIVTGDTPAEIRRQQQLEDERRQSMSYRLEEAAAVKPAKAEADGGGDDEVAQLKARIAELEAEKGPRPAAGGARRR